MTGCSCILTKKGAAFKESQHKKASCECKFQKDNSGTQAQSAALSHKKVPETGNSTSLKDDDDPQKWCHQSDPEEIEIDTDLDDVEDVEVDDGSDEVDKGGGEVDEGEGNGDNSDIEMLDSMVSHIDVGCIYAPYKVNPNIFQFNFDFLDIFHHTSMHPLFHNIYEFYLIFCDFISSSIIYNN